MLYLQSDFYSTVFPNVPSQPGMPCQGEDSKLFCIFSFSPFLSFFFAKYRLEIDLRFISLANLFYHYLYASIR